MTTYVLGAGASHHAGYPLCSELWSRMALWVTEEPVDSVHRMAMDEVEAINGPIVDIEEMLTNLDLGLKPFQALGERHRGKLKGKIRECLRDYFKSISDRGLGAQLYGAFATKLEGGDCIVTFNYDVALENELIRVGKFRVKNGYGFEGAWDEPESKVKVLKLHGSINWRGLLVGGGGPFVASSIGLGARPFVDNVDKALVGYPLRVLDTTFSGGSVTSPSITMIPPALKKKFAVTTTFGDEWTAFYDSLWLQAAESLERSSRIVLIGYSMPAADHQSRDMLLSNGNKQAEVVLGCASSNEGLRAEFQEHGFGRVRKLGGFEDLLQGFPECMSVASQSA